MYKRTLRLVCALFFIGILPLRGADEPKLSIRERVTKASKSFTSGHPLRARGDAALEEEQAQELEQIDAATQAAYEAARSAEKPLLRVREVKLEWINELDAFLQRHPGSPFDADICLELGRQAYLRSAYSKALNYYSRAWDATKNNREGESPYMAREASGFLAHLLAAMGRMEPLQVLETEAKQLGFSTKTAGWWWAMEVKAFALKYPQDSYKCGIFCLATLSRLNAPGTYELSAIMENESSPAGFSAADLVQVSSRAGVPANAVFVTDWSRLPLPAIVHLTSEHYVTVIEKRGDAYKVNDPLIGHVKWLSLPELVEEASGCILISQNQVGSLGTRTLTANEASEFRGRCHFGEPVELDDPAPSPSPGEEFDEVPGAYGGYPSKTCCGMPYLQVTEPGINAWIADIPLRYQPQYGPPVELKITRKRRVYPSPITGFYTFTVSFGQLVNSSWALWAELDSWEDHALCVLPNGSRALFEFSGSNTSLVNYRLNLTLEKVVSGGSVVALKLHNTRGGVIEYAIHRTLGDSHIFHVTKQIDKAGNYTAFQYTSSYGSYYLTNVVAADGKSFQLQLGTAAYATVPTNIVASYGATVSFGYGEAIDGNGAPWPDQLSHITDPVGITNQIGYGGFDVPVKLVTPYGITEIDENAQLAGDDTGIFDRTTLITYPDGTKEFWALMNAYPGPAWPAFSGSQIPSGAPTGTLDTDNRHERNTFHWTPEQWNPSWDISSTNDYNWAAFKKARIRHWLTADYPESTHFHTLSLEQSPSTDGGTTEGPIKWYDYTAKISDMEVGTQIMPAETSRTMPDGTTTYKKVTRNSIGKPTLEIEKWVANGVTKYRTNSYVYSADGIDLLEHRFDPSGVNRLIVGYGYDVSHPHLPVRITNSINEITYQTYDGSHRLVTVTTPSGMVISNTFGGDGFVSKTVEYDGSTIIRTNAYTWINGLLSTHTDPRGLMISNSWDYLNRPTRIDFPDGTYIGYAYTNGATPSVMLLQKTYEIDRLGFNRRYVYDSRERVSKEYDALGRVTAYGFCTCGAANYITNAFGSGVQEVTHYVFDDHHKITETYRPDSTATTNVYDALDRLVRVKNALGSITNTYDNLSRLVAVSNYFGQVSFTVYDDQDRVYSQTDANGVTITNTYDNLGRIQTTTYPDGGVDAWGYTSQVSAATSYTNRLGKVTTYSFDGLGRKLTETIAGLATHTFAYSTADDLLTLTDGKTQTTTYGINAYGLTVSKKYANGTTNLVYAFDANGRLTNRNSTAKGDAKYKYDAVGNLTNIDYATSADITIAYDELNRITKDVVTGLFTNLYTYEVGGALKTEDGPWASDTITNTYNSAGLRVRMSIQQPTSHFTNGYSFDTVGRLTNLTSHAGSFTYDYYPTNGGVSASTHLIRKLTQPYGGYITNSFDNNARWLRTQLFTSGNVEKNDHEYVYNAGNQRTRQTRTDNSYATYTYDDAGELRTTYTTNSAGSEVTPQRFLYGYDAAWNMIKRTNNTTVTTYTVNNLNQNTAWTFDSNGNPTYAQYPCDYDDENRLIRVTSTSSWKTEFQYDARGRLRKRLEYPWNGSSWYIPVETLYVYDGMLQIQQRDGNNVPVVTYTRGADLSGTIQGAGGIGGLLARSSSYASGSFTNHMFYHADAGGNITYLMMTNQTVGAIYRYDPYGQRISGSGTYADENLMRFSSKEFHEKSGFYNFGKRFYDPMTQRWLNRDPEDEAGGINLYAFTMQDPVNKIDPYGDMSTITFDLLGDNTTYPGNSEVQMFFSLQMVRLWEVLSYCRCLSGYRSMTAVYNTFPTGSNFGPADGEFYRPFEDGGRLTEFFEKLNKRRVPAMVTWHPMSPRARGWTPGPKTGILLNLHDAQVSTLAHELGHYADWSGEPGGHSHDPGNIMHSPANQYAVPDQEYCDKVGALAH